MRFYNHHYIRFPSCLNTILLNLHTIGSFWRHTHRFIRWLKPHRHAWERDVLLRPVCPGPFHVNNCLWEYVITPTARTAVVSNNGRATPDWVKHRSLFGDTYRLQNECWEREKHAYFGLITPDSIQDTMHMCNTFVPGTAKPDHCCWMQTVSLN